MRLGCFWFHALLLLWCATVEPACGGGGPHEHNHFLGSGLHSRSGAAGSGPCTLSLPAALVNDDFCDCADGSDEPRTSACAHVDWHDAARVPTPTRFACANDGHIPTQLAASRVQDGVCDCCDGTDEVPGRCAETCFEVGRAWREVREATERAIRSGLAKRNESLARLEASVAAARKDVAERRAELRRVEALTAGLRAHLALEEVCEYAEQLAAKNDCGVGPGGTATPASGGARAAGRQCVPQPLSRVRDLAARSRALAGVNGSSPHAHAVLSSRYDLPAGGDHGVGKEASGGELPAFVVARAFTEATVPSASDVRCNYRSHEHLHWSSLLARVLGVALVPTRLLWELVRLPFWLLTASPTPAPTPTPLPAGVDGAAVVGAPPTTAVSSLGILSLTAAGAKAAEGFVGTAWALSTLAWVPGMLSPRLDKRHRRTEATMLRQFIGTAEGEGTALRRAVKRLEELALLDTSSPDALLFLLGDECFQLVDNEYTYKVCPFQHVQQNGVSLGSWTEDANPNPFVPGADVRADRYSARAPSAYTMNFTKGRACHNGVTRAARVHFYCGDDNRVDTVQETELCKYEIDFFSPFVCSELSLSSSVL